MIAVEKRRSLVLVLVSLVTIAGVGPVAAVGSNGTAPFDESAVAVEQGESVTVDISFNTSDQMTLAIGPKEIVNYGAAVTVEDTTDDGTATVTFETSSLAVDPVDDAIEPGDGTRLINRSQSRLDHTLDPGEYTIAAFVDGDVIDTATLEITTDDADGSATLAIAEGSPDADRDIDGPIPDPDPDRHTGSSERVSFEGNPVIERGEMAPVTMTFDGTDRATVNISQRDEPGFEANVTVEDENNDGNATVLFDTAALGVDSVDEAIEAGNGTTVTNRSQVELERALPPDDYRLMATVDGEATDASYLSIHERSAESDASNQSPDDNGSEAISESTDGNETEVASESNGDGDSADDGLPGFGVGTALAGIVLFGAGFAVRAAAVRN